MTKYPIIVILMTGCLLTQVKSKQKKCQFQCLSFDLPRCEICYQKCRQSQEQQYKIKMKSCRQKQCFYSQDNCLNNLVTELSQEKCIQTCCYLNESSFETLSISKCNSTNRETNTAQTIGGIFINILLVLIILVILIFLVFFIIFIIQPLFFDRMNLKLKIIQEIKQIDQIQSKPSSIEAVKSQNWGNLYFSSNTTGQSAPTSIEQICCQICKEKSINCITNCQHHFHLFCLLKQIPKQQRKCPSCKNSKIKPLIVKCEICAKIGAISESFLDIQKLKKILHFRKIICIKCLKAQSAAGIAVAPSQDPQEKNGKLHNN